MQMAMAYTSVALLILSVSLPVDAYVFGNLNPKQLKAECDKTPYPGYCLAITKARHYDPMMYPMATPQDMAQYLMSIAARIGHDLTTMARAESVRLPGGSARRRCMQRCAAGFDAAASKLDVVDPELLDNSDEPFKLVYHFVQKKRNVLAENWDACPGKPTAGDMVAKQKHFVMLMDVILALGKLPRQPPL
ncbi:hypothetical protein ACQ4PT_048769 [Festuca glaucescens]